MAERITPFRDMLHLPWLPSAWEWHSTAGVVALNTEITRQASTIAYLNDFTVMMWMTLAAAALPLVVRSPARRPARTRRIRMFMAPGTHKRDCYYYTLTVDR